MLLQLEQKYDSFEAYKHPFVPSINHTKPNYSQAVTPFPQTENNCISYQHNKPKTPQHKRNNSEVIPHKYIRYQCFHNNGSPYINGTVKTETKPFHMRNNSFNYDYLQNRRAYTNYYNGNDMCNSVSYTHDGIGNYCSFNNDMKQSNQKQKYNFRSNYNNRSSSSIYVNKNYSNVSNNSIGKPITAINLNKMNLTLSRSTISILSTRNKTNRGNNNSNIHSIMPNTPMSTRLHQFNNLSNPITNSTNFHTIQYHNNNLHNNTGSDINNHKHYGFINQSMSYNSSSDLHMYFKASSNQKSKRGSYPSLPKTHTKSSLNNTNESIINKTILHCTESGSNTIPVGPSILNGDKPVKSINNNINMNNKLSAIKRNPSSMTSHLNNSSLDGKTTHYNSQNKSKTDSQIMLYSNISNNNNLDRSKSSKNIKKGNNNNSNSHNNNEIKYSFRTNPHSPNHNYPINNHNTTSKTSVNRLISPKDFNKAFLSTSNNKKGMVSTSKNAFLVPSKSEQTSVICGDKSKDKNLLMQRKVVDENIYPQLNYNRNQRNMNLYKGNDDKYEITLQSMNDSKLYEIANHYITTDESLDKYQCMSYACSNNNYYSMSKKK